MTLDLSRYVGKLLPEETWSPRPGRPIVEEVAPSADVAEMSRRGGGWVESRGPQGAGPAG